MSSSKKRNSGKNSKKTTDSDRAKKRLELRSNIEDRKKKIRVDKTKKSPKTQYNEMRDKRKKILEYKKQQSRYKLPKIDPNESMSDIKKKSKLDEINKEWNEEFNNKDDDIKKNDDNNDIKSKKINDENDKNNINKKENENESKKDENNDKNDKKYKINLNDDDTDDDENESFASLASVEELVLTPDAEETMCALENAFEDNDPDYFGFIEWDLFLKILKENGVDIPKKDMQMFAKAVQMIEEEGVNYCGFLSQMRSLGTNINGGVTEICAKLISNTENGILDSVNQDYEQELLLLNSSKDIVEQVMEQKVNFKLEEKEKKKKKKKKKKNGSKKKPINHRSKSIANLKPENPLTSLIDDLALEGADVDFALLKVALAMINEKPNDNDLEYIINYLCQDNTGFIDFTYFITFLQDASKTPPEKFKNITKIITKVAQNLRIMQRAEKRRMEQERKLKNRLMKRRTTNSAMDINKTRKMMTQARKDRAKALRAKMKNFR